MAYQDWETDDTYRRKCVECDGKGSYHMTHGREWCWTCRSRGYVICRKPGNHTKKRRGND